MISFIPGRISIKEQLLSIHNIVVRYNSSIFAVDTVELYVFKSGSHMRPNWCNKNNY